MVLVRGRSACGLLVAVLVGVGAGAPAFGAGPERDQAQERAYAAELAPVDSKLPEQFLKASRLQQEAEAIRTLGAASFVLSSDLGQPQNPLHTDGLLAMYKGLMANGVGASDIDLMSRRNPARLLGLDR